MGRWHLSELNRMEGEAFVEALGDIVEDSPWVAEEVALRRPFRDLGALGAAFGEVLRAAPHGAQLAVVQAHPDLGGKLDAVSAASRAEQHAAGLAALDAAERERLRELNDAYRVKFGFPFILAVRGADAPTILAAFEERLPNELEAEFATAVAEVERIAEARLYDRIRET